jgi:N-glycosylase/DNA lyase
MKMEALGQTLDCGQSFRWNCLPDGTWEGVACGRYLHITQENLPGVLRDGFWARYFDMGLDYEKIRADFCAMNPVLAEAAHYAPEIRILNQAPWEALCSFLLSQCNNIKRIKGLVARLCAAYGRPVDGMHRAFSNGGIACPRGGEPTARSWLRLSRPLCFPPRRAVRREGKNRLGCAPMPAAGRSARQADGTARRRSEGCGLRAALRPAPARCVSDGRVDEARHEGTVPGQKPGGVRPLRGALPSSIFSTTAGIIPNCSAKAVPTVSPDDHINKFLTIHLYLFR